VLRILRNDIYAPTGAVMVRRGLALRGTLLLRASSGTPPATWWSPEGALAGTRITLGTSRC